MVENAWSEKLFVTHHFLSYSSVDGLEFAQTLHNKLEAGPPPFGVWMDKQDLRPGDDWDEQIKEAIGRCDTLLFVMTADSVEANSVCKLEWTRALKYKKPIVPLLLSADAEMPFGLGNRQYIDFSSSFDAGLAKLREHLSWLQSPAGVLHTMQDQLTDAKRELRRAPDETGRVRYQQAMEDLEKRITDQQGIVNGLKAAIDRATENIQRGLERERQPEKPIAIAVRSKFINPPPGVAPVYFQDRTAETRLIGDFLKHEGMRLMTIVGQGGIGKTAMVCRLLKALEGGQLPDDGGSLLVDGIVYLSATGSRRITTPNLYADLCALLAPEIAAELEAVYKMPTTSTQDKMRALLARFANMPSSRVVVLLDNFEDLLHPETRQILDAELNEALGALLTLPYHAVKVIITTRVVPAWLALIAPERQEMIALDEGLPAPYAENILREMDRDGRLGLKTAPDALLSEARQRTKGYPRALEALVAALRADSATTLQEILEVAGKQLPENVTRVLVGEAFNRLDPEAQRVMEGLAIYRRPVTPTAIDYLLQPYLPGLDSAPILNRLANMYFVRKEAGRFYLHPVDQAYALGRIAPGEKSDTAERGQPLYTQFTLRDRGAGYFLQARKPREEWKTIDDIAPQLAEIELRIDNEEFDPATDVLLSIDANYLSIWGYYRLLLDLYQRLTDRVTDLALRRRALGRMGSAYWFTGQARLAIPWHEKALALARQSHEPWQEAHHLNDLALCSRELGNTTLAIDYYDQILTIVRDLGDKRNEAVTLGNMAECYRDLGQLGRAIEHHAQALELARAVGDRHLEGIALGNLGNCYGYQGKMAMAIKYHEQALAAKREVGNKRGEGITLGNLGSCYADVEQMERAISYCQQSLEIAREVGNLSGELRLLSLLSALYYRLDRSGEALHDALKAVNIAEELAAPPDINTAHFCLGRVCLFSGDLMTARRSAEIACEQDIARAKHHEFALLGVVAVLQGDHAVANQAFARALNHADKMLSQEADNYGALYAQGLALCGLALIEGEPDAQARIADAVEAYASAIAFTVEAPGTLAEAVRLFEALAQADKVGVLTPVRGVIAAQR
jgi:tetratricopeptide (TPR) repeat protein